MGSMLVYGKYTIYPYLNTSKCTWILWVMIIYGFTIDEVDRSQATTGAAKPWHFGKRVAARLCAPSADIKVASKSSKSSKNMGIVLRYIMGIYIYMYIYISH